jgi:uncharacterized protein
LVDPIPLPARFLILGSASPNLLRQSPESLAGRISTITMSGFSLAEVGKEAQNQLWRRGGFPPSFTADNEGSSLEWRKDFVRTFLERDIPQLGFNIPSTSLYRFWSLLAHYHGQIWNNAEAARTLNVGEATARRYLDLLGFLDEEPGLENHRAWLALSNLLVYRCLSSASRAIVHQAC